MQFLSLILSILYSPVNFFFRLLNPLGKIRARQRITFGILQGWTG